MRTSKFNQLSLILLGVVTSLLLGVGCTQPTPREQVGRPGELGPLGELDQDGEKGTANFVVTGLLKGNSHVREVNEWSQLPTVRTYTFEACIQYLAVREKAEYQRFVVETPQGQSYEVVADDNGCIFWSEDFSYNSLMGEPGYVGLTRWIRGVGSMRGRLRQRIAIYPWKEDWGLSGQEVIDLEKQPRAVREEFLLDERRLSVADLDARGRRRQSQLFLNRISLGFTPGERRQGGYLNKRLRLDLEPQVSRQLLSESRWLFSPLAHGKFDLELLIFGVVSVQGEEEDALARESRILLGRLEAEEVGLRLGRLSLDRQIRIERQCAACEIEVALRIKPTRGGMNDLEPFAAVYLLGDEGSLDRVNTGRVRSWSLRQEGLALEGQFSEPFDLDQWIASWSKLRRDLKKEPVEAPEQLRRWEEASEGELPSGFYRAQQFEFSNLDPRFVGVETCETATERSLRFRVETKVTHPSSGKPYRDYKFRVQARENDGSLTEIRLANDRTLRDGSLIWEDVLTHQYYVTQEYQIRNYIITDVESGAQFEHSIAINPWDWGFTFGADFRARGKENILQRNAEARERAIQPQLLNYGFRYETVGFRYEMDENMTLRVHKNILLRLDPRVLRYDSLVAGRNHNEPLRDGLYILRVGFQKQYINQYGEEDEYIDTYEVITQVRAGVIVEEVEISMTDLTLMRVRSHFLVEIEPVDEAYIRKSCDFTRGVHEDRVADFEAIRMDPKVTGLRPRTFVGPVILLANYFGAGMRPTDELDNYWISSRIRDRYRMNGVDDLSEPEGRQNGRERPRLGLRETHGGGLGPSLDPKALDQLKDSICERGGDASSLKDSFVNTNYERELNEFCHTLSVDEVRERLSLALSHLQDFQCASRVDPQLLGLEPGAEVPEFLIQAHCHQPMAGAPQDPEGQEVKGFYEYFIQDSPRLMADMTIRDHLMPRQEWLREQAAQKVGEYARLSSKLQMSNVEYLQMHNLHRVGERISPEELRFANLAFEGSADPKNFLFELNSSHLAFYHPNLIEVRHMHNTVDRVSQADLDDLMYRGLISEALGIRLCHFWFNKFIPRSIPEDREAYRKGFLRGRAERSLPTLCAEAFNQSLRKERDRARRNNQSYKSYIRPEVPGGQSGNPFRLVRQLKVGQVSDYIHTNGVSMNLQISADLKLNFAKDFRFGKGHNVNVGLPRGITEWFFGSSYNWGFQYSWGQTDSKIEGAGISTGTYLVVQKAQFLVRVEEFENCIHLTMNPGFFKDNVAERFFSPYLHSDEALFLLTRGVKICTGITEKGPLDLRENFYYVAQHFTEGDMLDLGDRKNHPWLMALRGDYDYIRMVNLLSAVNLRDQKNIWHNNTDFKSIFEVEEFTVEDELEALRGLGRGVQDGWTPGGTVTGATRFPPTAEMTRLEAEAQKARQDISQERLMLMSPGRGNLPPGVDPVKLLLEQTEKHKDNPNAAPVFISRAANSIEYQYFSQPGRKDRIRDLRNLDRYDIAIFPFKHPQDVYKGLVPTFPGYITLTPESLVCQPRMSSVEIGGNSPICHTH